MRKRHMKMTRFYSQKSPITLTKEGTRMRKRHMIMTLVSHKRASYYTHERSNTNAQEPYEDDASLLTKEPYHTHERSNTNAQEPHEDGACLLTKRALFALTKEATRMRKSHMSTKRAYLQKCPIALTIKGIWCSDEIVCLFCRIESLL